MSGSETIWAQKESGILFPDGRISTSGSLHRTDYLGLRAKAQLIEDVFAEAGVRLPLNSELSRMIQTAKNLWGDWFLNDHESLTWPNLFQSMHLARIADAILPLREVDVRATYLRRLLSGTLDFFERISSKAKDILWELEAWSRFVRADAIAHLIDPPDIIVEYERYNIGIACKNIYSERHIQNVLSQAVRQLERHLDFGIVAVNLDELLPPSAVLKEHSSRAASDRLQAINAQFLARHSKHFEKYLSRGRLISALVSTCMVTDIPTEQPRFRNTFEWTVWTMPGADEKSHAPLQELYDTLIKKPIR